MTLPVIGRDPGPLARLEHVKLQEATPSVVFQRLCEGETLRDIAKAWQIPVGLFVEWFTTEHLVLFDTALKVRADQLAHEAVAIADEQKEAVDKNGKVFDPEVPRDKLRVDTRLKLAAQWDRARYGAKDSGPAGGGITVVVDRSCGGTVSIQSGDSKLVVAGRQERIISNEEGVI